MSGPEHNPMDDIQDEEEMFVFTVAEMIQEGKVSLAKIHLRSYIEHAYPGAAEKEAECKALMEIVVRILCEAKPGAALNAVSEDYPEIAKMIFELKALGPCGKHPKMFDTFDGLIRDANGTIHRCTICEETRALREEVGRLRDDRGRIIFELHRSHRRAGDFNFGVSCSIDSLSIEEMNNFRKMLMVAIGTAEDAFRRGMEARNPAQSAAKPPEPAVAGRVDPEEGKEKP